MSWFVAVQKTHMDSEDLRRFAIAPDFFNDEPTVRVALCPSCVKLATRCVCEMDVNVEEVR